VTLRDPRRRFDLIVSQGRIADRTDGAIAGAARTAQALEPVPGTKVAVVGSAAPPSNDGWQTALDEAKETLGGLRRSIEESLRAGRVPVMTANTCAASLASLPVAAREHPDAFLLWFDAHGDFNTPETTPSGYLGGMVLAAACGLWNSGYGAGLRGTQVVLVGARDIDAAEGDLLRTHGVRILAPQDATPAAVAAIVGDAPVWIHLDWDVLEPGSVPTAYRVPGGLAPATVREILETIPAERARGVELAELEAPPGRAGIDGALAVIVDTVRPLFS
jgi:arginase/N-omega-hydroxy-L-arginine amidinohydrolase